MASLQAAKRYARALFELAQEQQILEQVQADVTQLGELMTHATEWQVLASHYQVTPEARKKLFRTVFTGRLHELTLRFLNFLVDKGRNTILRDILREFTSLYYDAKGIVAVRIISAFPLDPGQLAALVERVQARLGKQVAPTVEVDPALLGGFQIRVNDQVYDCSVNHQLDRAYRSLVTA